MEHIWDFDENKNFIKVGKYKVLNFKDAYKASLLLEKINMLILKILIAKRRKGDLVKIIASNIRLKKFINWRPKFNSLNKIVKSCLNWEKRQ